LTLNQLKFFAHTKVFFAAHISLANFFLAFFHFAKHKNSQQKMSFFQRAIYNTLFKKTGNYVGFVVAGAIAVEVAVDKGIELVWDTHNKGVSTRQ